MSFAPLLDAAGVAWNAERHRDPDLAERLDALVFQDDARALGGACVAMGDLSAQTGLVGWNASALHAALLGSSTLARWATPDARAAAAIAESIEGLSQDVGRARPGCADGASWSASSPGAAARADRRAGGSRAARARARPTTRRCARSSAAAIEEQRACWLARARPGGLDDSVARLERAVAELGA